MAKKVKNTTNKTIPKDTLMTSDGKPAAPNQDLPKSKFKACVKTDPNAKFIVLTLTNIYGKTFTCRTVEELDTFFTNYTADKSIKRDEDIGVSLGWGRMTETEYGRVPACKYFIKEL